MRLCVNRFQAFCIPYVWIATPSMQEQGLKLHVSQRVRVPVESVDPMVKHCHWLDFEMGLYEAYDLNADSVRLVDFERNITEGPGFNIFAVIDGKLTTPDRGMLDGMTRRTVIELAEDLQIARAQAPVSAAALYGASEVFLTTTAGGVIPVTSIDGQAVGTGSVGRLTAILHEAYWARRSEGWHAEPVNYYAIAQPSVS